MSSSWVSNSLAGKEQRKMAWHALLCSPPLNFLNGAEKVIWLILLGNANRKDKTKRLEDLHALLQASPAASHLWHPWKEPSDCSPLKHSWCASGMRFLQLVHPTQSIAPSKGCCFSRGNLGRGWGVMQAEAPSQRTLLPSSSSTNMLLPKTSLGIPFPSVPLGSITQPACLFWQGCASWGGVCASKPLIKMSAPLCNPTCTAGTSPCASGAAFLGEPHCLPQNHSPSAKTPVPGD